MFLDRLWNDIETVGDRISALTRQFIKLLIQLHISCAELGPGDVEMKVTIPEFQECRVSSGRQIGTAGSNNMCSAL